MRGWQNFRRGGDGFGRGGQDLAHDGKGLSHGWKNSLRGCDDLCEGGENYRGRSENDISGGANCRNACEGDFNGSARRIHSEKERFSPGKARLGQPEKPPHRAAHRLHHPKTSMPPTPLTWDGTDAQGQPLRWNSFGLT